MQERLSAEYVKRAEEKAYLTPLYLKMKLARYINKWRRSLRFLMRYRKYGGTAVPGITQNLEKAAAHFQAHGWVYVENIISEEFYEELVKNFPKRCYFETPTKLAKSYDTGFNWSRGQQFDFNRYDPYHQHQTLLKFKDYLGSVNFQERITKFIGLNKNFVCFSFTVNRTQTGSQVIPHKDGIQYDPDIPAFINMVFFINGTGGKNSGNLSLSRDSDFEDMIVEPDNLKNACLIYDSMADFYHGFRPVEQGKFRLAINSQFCEKGFKEK